MPDGSTYRDHMLALERSGVDTGELVPPPIPPGFEELVDAFWQLRRCAGSNGMTAGSITYSDLLAWQQLYRVELEPLEVDLLFSMDIAALAAHAEK